MHCGVENIKQLFSTKRQFPSQDYVSFLLFNLRQVRIVFRSFFKTSGTVIFQLTANARDHPSIHHGTHAKLVTSSKHTDNDPMHGYMQISLPARSHFNELITQQNTSPSHPWVLSHMKLSRKEQFAILLRSFSLLSESPVRSDKQKARKTRYSFRSWTNSYDGLSVSKLLGFH